MPASDEAGLAFKYFGPGFGLFTHDCHLNPSCVFIGSRSEYRHPRTPGLAGKRDSTPLS
jgi:hypothetical protein